METLGRGITWLDTGTPESLLEAGNFIETIEKRQGWKVGCLEEIALNQRWVTAADLTARVTGNSAYDRYVRSLLSAGIQPS